MKRSRLKRTGGLKRSALKYKPNREGMKKRAEVRRQAIERSGGRCELCGGEFGWLGPIVDHVEPLGMGGDRYDYREGSRNARLNSVENAMAICQDCDEQKTRGSRTKRAALAFSKGDNSDE